MKVLTDTGVRVVKNDGHENTVSSTPVWKVLADAHYVYPSTAMPGEMESSAGIAPA